MRVECIVDGKTLSLSLNSNKPLSYILADDIGSPGFSSCCKGNGCGNCIALVDGKPVLSCLVPAFEINGKTIITFESFRKTRNYKDIEKAYEIVKIRPCPACFESRTLLFESLISRGITKDEDIKRDMATLICACMDPADEIRIVKEAINIRRRRRVRRS